VNLFGAVFAQFNLVDLPVQEVAAVMETSAKEIRRRAHRARLMLRGVLNGLV
jgi:DNA-directed RNA polymerase specialized sigma24 family protein